MHSKVEKLINKTAKEHGWDPSVVKDVVDISYGVARELMSDRRHPRVLLPGFGALVPRATKVEDEVSKLLSVIKTHRNPSILYDNLRILTLTAKRIRHEQFARRASLPSEMVERAKQRIRETGCKQRTRSLKQHDRGD